MQVRAKDSKHLFSLYNLLDFLDKKADITDCLKQHRLMWRIHDICFIVKMKWEHQWRWEGYRETDCEKETRKWEKRGRINTVRTSLFTPIHKTKFPPDLLSTPVRDDHVHQTFDWFPGSCDDQRSSDILRGTSFFNTGGGKRGRWRVLGGDAWYD